MEWVRAAASPLGAYVQFLPANISYTEPNIRPLHSSYLARSNPFLALLSFSGNPDAQNKDFGVSH